MAGTRSAILRILSNSSRRDQVVFAQSAGSRLRVECIAEVQETPPVFIRRQKRAEQLVGESARERSRTEKPDSAHTVRLKQSFQLIRKEEVIVWPGRFSGLVSVLGLVRVRKKTAIQGIPCGTPLRHISQEPIPPLFAMERTSGCSLSGLTRYGSF